MPKGPIRVQVDTSTLRRRARRLQRRVRTKKTGRLWPAISEFMKGRYQQMFSSGWPGLPRNDSEYRRWKRHWGFPQSKLVMTGRLKQHMTTGDGPIDPAATTERQLVFTLEDVRTSWTGPGPRATSSGDPPGDSKGVGWHITMPHRSSPMEYMVAVVRGASVPKPYGHRQARGRVRSHPGIVWRRNWITGIRLVSGVFLFRQARKVWGSEVVTKR